MVELGYKHEDLRKMFNFENYYKIYDDDENKDLNNNELIYSLDKDFSRIIDNINKLFKENLCCKHTLLLN